MKGATSGRKVSVRHEMSRTPGGVAAVAADDDAVRQA